MISTFVSDSFVGLSITVEASREVQCENAVPTEGPEKDRNSGTAAWVVTVGAVKAWDFSMQTPEKTVRANKTATHKLTFEKDTAKSIVVLI